RRRDGHRQEDRRGADGPTGSAGDARHDQEGDNPARRLMSEPWSDHPDLEAMMPAVYAELRRLAAHSLRGERPGQTLQPTALVHEAYLKLQKDRPERWQNRAHFCAIAAHAQPQILIERARARAALTGGGGAPRVTFDEGLPAQAADRGF